jgi:hypothetical protein
MSKKSIFGPDHKGRHTPMALHPATVVSHQSHGVTADQAARHGDRPNIARDAGRGKIMRPVPVHPASHRVSGTAEGAPVVTTLSAIPIADNPAVNDPTKPGKAFIGRAVGVNPGTRDRSGDPLHGGNPDPRGMKQQMQARQSHAQQRHAANVELGRQVLAEALRTK